MHGDIFFKSFLSSLNKVENGEIQQQCKSFKLNLVTSI